jgi:serine/threonine protein kinase
MSDRVGQQLGNYRLIKLLGRGGFAEVYLGEHCRLGSQAAIKVLHTHLVTAEEKHFLAEARTIAHLEHPHIIRILEFDVSGGTPFLVMSYAPNGNLRQRHPKGSQLPLQQILDYIQQITDALQYAHDEKLIHRDIKPENMLLGKRNELLLSDFGIALIAQSSRDQSTQDVVGTAYYMAPEQFQGKPCRASDQYALGVIVYEWLSGNRPFHGSFSEIASQHMFTPPPSLCQQISSLSPSVEQVVLRALAKDPIQRFESVRTFATALEKASSLPDPAPLVKPVRPQRISRRSIILGVGVVVAATSVGGVAWAIATSNRTPIRLSPTTATSSLTATPSPVVYTEGVANLSYSTDLDHWGINWYPSEPGLTLSTTLPTPNWVQPASRGIKRFFGILNFVNDTRVNIVLDQTTSLDNRGFFGGLAVFSFGNDTAHEMRTEITSRRSKERKGLKEAMLHVCNELLVS